MSNTVVKSVIDFAAVFYYNHYMVKFDVFYRKVRIVIKSSLPFVCVNGGAKKISCYIFCSVLFRDSVCGQKYFFVWNFSGQVSRFNSER